LYKALLVRVRLTELARSKKYGRPIQRRFDMAPTYEAATMQANSAARNNVPPMSVLPGRDEQNLIAGAKRGESAAFDELCQAHTKRLFRATFRIAKNREDAEDALQDALLLAFVHIQSFDGKSSFSTWLTRIAINTALMMVRKKRPNIAFFLDDPNHSGGPSEIAAPTPNPEENFVRREQEAILRDAIRELRPAIRQALELQQLLELSLDETAKMLGVSLTATKSRLFHGKAELRKSSTLKAIGRSRVTGSYALPPAA
jgi:RNA polymerase sigma factor (sigma-70 family)